MAWLDLYADFSDLPIRASSFWSMFWFLFWNYIRSLTSMINRRKCCWIHVDDVGRYVKWKKY
jgi:hypothetical protein